jgi:hypothetical protein
MVQRKEKEEGEYCVVGSFVTCVQPWPYVITALAYGIQERRGVEIRALHVILCLEHLRG